MMRFMLAFFLLLSILIGVLIPQTSSDFDNLYHFYSHFYLQRIANFHIKDYIFGLSSSRDSNFFMHPDIVEIDNSVTLNLSLRGAYLYKQKLILEVLPFVSYVNHFDHSEYSFLNRGLTTNLYVKLGHRLLWWNSYSTSKRRWRVYETFGQLAVFDNQRARTKLTYETARSTAIFLEARIDKTQVSGDLLEDESMLDDRYNRETFNLGAGLSYRLTAKTTATLTAGVYQTDFPNFPRQDHHGFQVQLGVRFPQVGTEEGRINGRVLFGLKAYELDQYKKHFATWIADTDLVVASGRLRWHIQANRDFDFAVFQVSPLVRTSAFAGLEYYFSKRMFLGAGFRYHHLDFRVPLIIDWERKFVTAAAGTPELTFGIRTLHRYWLTLTWSRSNWTSGDYFYYNKQRSLVSFSFIKRL